MVGAIAVLMMLGAVYALVLGPRHHPFDARLADMRMRRSTGPNAATLLGVVGLAALLLKSAELPVVADHPILIPLLVGAAVLLVIGYVVDGSATKAIAAAAGVLLLIATQGLTGTVELVILALILWWLLGAARGYLG